MGMDFNNLPEIEIHHLTMLDLSVVAYLAPHSREFYENAVTMMLPMDDPDIQAIKFLNPDEDFVFTRGETFELQDKQINAKWYCQVVRMEDEHGYFIGRIVPIPPLESYIEEEPEPERRPLLTVVASSGNT